MGMNQTQVNRRHVLGVAAGSLVGAVLLSACSPSASASSSTTPSELDISILTGGMIGKKEWPVFVPSNITLPANSTVNVRIFDFDDGTAAMPDNSPFTKVTGVVGNKVTVQSMGKGDPNALGQAKSISELAGKDIAHTFTISALKLNVPIPVTSVASFQLKTGKAGTYTWQCLAPCGSDPNGMGGAMVGDGYMKGTLKIV